MNNIIIFDFDNKIHANLSNDFIVKLKNKSVKNFYRADYTLFDFFKDILIDFSWWFKLNKKYTVKEILDTLKTKYLEVAYLYDDILSCL